VSTPDHPADNRSIGGATPGAAVGGGGSAERAVGPLLDTGLECLVRVARMLGQAADVNQFRHQFGRGDRPLELIELVRAARHLGFKAKSARTSWKRLQLVPLPALAQARSGAYFILGRVADEQVLIWDATEGKPKAVTRKAFEDVWTGELLLIARRAALFSSGGRFGFGWFMPAVIKYRRLFVEVLLTSFFLQLLALGSPLFTQVVIDKVLVHRSLGTLDVIAFGLIAVSAFEALLGGLRTYLFSHTTNRIDVELGVRLFRHLLALPMSYFQARRVGDSVARVRELENIRNFLTSNSVTVIIDAVFTVVFLVVMLNYSPALTLIVLAAAPFYVLLSWVITPMLRRRLEEKFSRGAENQAFLVESVTAAETVKAMAIEPQMHRRWEEQLAAYVSTSFRATSLSNVASQSVNLISKLTTTATLWYGAHLVIGGELTVGQLVAFNMLSARVSSPILRMAQLWQDFQQVRVSLERLGDILNTVTEPVQAPGRGVLPTIQGRITFENVGFRYRLDGSPVLRGFSLDVPAGQVLGVVGPSGSGKSTVTKLIQRLYVPESGRVMVDGVDLAMVDPAWLRRQIGVVLQEDVLFNRTIRDNIAVGNPGLDIEHVVAAARLSGAHEFVLELPQGYDTVVGERGGTLSGGQRQRIAIARALIGNPRILIFDEATSALDYESERAIQDNMQLICRGRTVIIVAHRLAAVRQANRIVTIEKGVVLEDGSHDELVRKGGRYAALYRHQVGAA
jgi:subfamily B ATP-binding cassette protein HlyB/CyaB